MDKVDEKSIQIKGFPWEVTDLDECLRGSVQDNSTFQNAQRLRNDQNFKDANLTRPEADKDPRENSSLTNKQVGRNNHPKDDGGAHDAAQEVHIALAPKDDTTSPHTNAKPSRENQVKYIPQKIIGISSFIRPPEAPKFRDSLKQGASMVILMSLNATVLGIPPTIVLLCMISTTWVMSINYYNVLLYYLISTSILISICYFSMYYMALTIFGEKRSQPLLYRITIPSLILHLVTYNIRIIYQLRYLSLAYYLCFIICNSLTLHFVTFKKENMMGKELDRYDILSSDGTSLAIMKGMLLCTAAYYFSVIHLIPFILKQENFIVRLIGRLFLLPMLFSTADAYQSNLIMSKSREHMRYRMIVGNFTFFIYQTILRMLTTNSQGILETTIMSSSSAVLDVIMRSTLIIRMAYFKKMRESFRMYMCNCFQRGSRIENLSNIAPHDESLPSGSSSNETKTCDRARTTARQRSIQEFLMGWGRIKMAVSQMNEEDEFTRCAKAHHAYRSHFICITEIYLIFFIPVTLYLHRPLQNYITLKTFDTFEEALLSLLVQLPFGVVTQILCIAIERYFYGIDAPQARKMTDILNFRVILRATILSMACIYLVLNPFLLSTEHWPNK